MNYDDMISKMRLIRQSNQTMLSNYLETLLQTYQQTLQHQCQEARFIDKGYYYRRNGEMYLCTAEEKEKADFRAIECEECHQEILLMNTGRENWDMIFTIVPNENVPMMKTMKSKPQQENR